MKLSVVEIIALAPDASFTKLAQSLAKSEKWSRLAFNENTIRGVCQGEGSEIFTSQVDLTELSFQCACSSLQSPCPHVLALLLMWHEYPQVFQHPSSTNGEMNDWALATQQLHRESESHMNKICLNLSNIYPTPLIEKPNQLSTKKIIANALRIQTTKQETCAIVIENLPQPLTSQVDYFWVVGIHYLRQDETLLERRIWLFSVHQQKRVWLSDCSHQGLDFQDAWMVGACYALEVDLLSDEQGLKAIVKNKEAFDHLPAIGLDTPSDLEQYFLSKKDVLNWQAEKNWQAQFFSQSPNANFSPMLIQKCEIWHSLKVLKSGAEKFDWHEGLFAKIDEDLIALELNEVQQLELLIFSIHQKISLMGEWNQHKLVPLFAFSKDDQCLLSSAH